MKTGAEKIVWNLKDIYSSAEDPKIKIDMNLCLKESEDISKKYKGKIETGNINANDLLLVIKKIEDIFSKLIKISSYAHLSLTTDNTDDTWKNLAIKSEEFYANVKNKLIFFDIEITKINDDKFKELIKNPELKNYLHYLNFIRKMKPHILSEKEEAIINKKEVTGRSAIQKIYEELKSSFKFSIKINDEIKTLNESQIRALRESSDEKLRSKSSKVYLKKYEENSLVIVNAYNAILKDHQLDCELKNYNEPDEPRNLENELDSSIVKALSDTTLRNSDIVSEYYVLKAKLMKKNKLSLADIYAPIKTSKKEFSFNEAKEIVFASYKNFDEKAFKTIEKFFINNWIHASLCPHKTSGAFCSSSSPDHHPYVMLNFTGSTRDVETMAHELGHGMHAILASKQTLVNFHPIMPLAEIASVFGEMLVVDYLLEKIKDKNEKISFICSKLESSIATTFRQNMFYRFEKRTHTLSKEKNIPQSELREIYRDELHKMFGNSVTIPKEFEMEWSVVQHIFMWPFYVYAYNFAQLVVFSLYQKYLEDGKKFIPVYYEILSSGSSDTPQEILKKANIDLKDGSFWQKGFDFMRNRWLNEIKKLV
jgi:oligoendopeptidase F